MRQPDAIVAVEFDCEQGLVPFCSKKVSFPASVPGSICLFNALFNFTMMLENHGVVFDQRFDAAEHA